MCIHCGCMEVHYTTVSILVNTGFFFLKFPKYKVLKIGLIRKIGFQDQSFLSSVFRSTSRRDHIWSNSLNCPEQAKVHKQVLLKIIFVLGKVSHRVMFIYQKQSTVELAVLSGVQRCCSDFFFFPNVPKEQSRVIESVGPEISVSDHGGLGGYSFQLYDVLRNCCDKRKG